jgi:hypothetical protein
MGLTIHEVVKPDTSQFVSEVLSTNTLHVVIEGSNPEDVTSAAARSLAYKERLQHGMDRAGISQEGGPYAVDCKTGEPPTNAADIAARKEDLRYRQVFKITLAL